MGTKQISLSQDDESSVSERLIEACLSRNLEAVCELLLNDFVDVNHKGSVNLHVKYSACIQHEEGPDELKIGYEEFRTAITPIFAAAHAGHIDILKRLLNYGVDVNQKLYKGYPITAAAREGHHEALRILLKAGASQDACEEALLEACLFGQVKAVELLINSEMTRPEVAASALVHASCRGLVDIVATLIKNGVDANCWHRVLLRSAKPVLHASADCTPLFAAIVSRQVHVVEFLLKAGARTDLKARLGAWTWDSSFGDALRIGAGMAEPYNEAWCAVEYWEASGTILRMLLEHLHPDCLHQGRTLLFHAILCCNVGAAKVILEAGGKFEECAHTKDGPEFQPLHLAARLGVSSMLQLLIIWGCNINAQTGSGETALMICATLGHRDSFKELVNAGADFGIANIDGDTVFDVVERNNDGSFVYEIIRDCILAGQKIKSSGLPGFYPLHFAARHGYTEALQKLVQQKKGDINELDHLGYTATMISLERGHMEAFRVLVFAGADMNMTNRRQTALDVAEQCGNKQQCEEIILNAILADILKWDGFKSLHFAARKGNLEVLTHLLKRGCSVNALDEEEYTPLMLSAKEGYPDACKLLLQGGADCFLMNSRGETALILTSRNIGSKLAGVVILDHIAKKKVFSGGQLTKHTRGGKGPPHIKYLCMLKSGVLTWGKTSRRNVMCKEAIMGPSSRFQKKRWKSNDFKEETFRIVTVSGRQIHFVAPTASDAELWVRGINVVTTEVMSSND